MQEYWYLGVLVHKNAGVLVLGDEVCLPSGNWGSSHPCGNIAKCGENNIQQKNWKRKK
jgi:hypothetical protein